MLARTVLLSLFVVSALAGPTPVLWNRGNSKIIGGTVAPRGAFPFAVSIRLFDYGFEDLHMLGGAIIGPRTVVTVGYGIEGTPATSLDVVYGSTQLDCRGMRYRVSETLLHPGFNGTDFSNDIGLVFVAQNFKLGPDVAIIPIARSMDLGGTAVATMGWGRTVAEVNQMSNDLLYVNETTVSNGDCASLVPPGGSIRAEDLCTVSPAGMGTCSNDAGGPIVSGNTLVGIAALGFGACASDLPDLAVRVSYFNEWITENIK